MKTVVAETVMLGREAFETLGEVEVVPDRSIGPGHLQDADALIIRSKTKVTPELIKGSSVRFVGTATAGFEHIDLPLSSFIAPSHSDGASLASHRVQTLEKNHIGWCAAPGCNANSVADYITAALLSHTCTCVGIDQKTLGIIGFGQVGSRVAKRAEALGLRVVLNDPPRAAREFPMSGTDGVGAGDSFPDSGKKSSKVWKNQAERFQTLEKVLSQSDIVTLHVPLVSEKPWPTLRMVNCRFFEKMKRGSVFINAARGKVLDSDALLHAKENGIVSHAVLDVWDPEPNIRTDILEIADIGTAHIAGHSLEGKLNGTVHVYREACHFFETEPIWDPAPLLPAVDVPELQIDSRGKSDHEVMAEAVAAVYDIAADDAALRGAPETFDALRANYGVRREFFNTRVTLSENRSELIHKLRTIGFNA